MAGLVVFKSFNFLIQIVEFDPFHRPPEEGKKNLATFP
jgi:hypothetical protein